MKNLMMFIKQNNLIITLVFLLIGTGMAFLIFSFASKSLINIILLYILTLMFIVRYTNNYYYGAMAAFISIACANYFFSYPYFKFNFTQTEYFLTCAEILAITLFTTTTTSHVKSQSQMLEERDKQLVEAEKEKMRANLLRAVSHDLRTPLTSIIGEISSFRENADNLSEEEKNDLAKNIYDDAIWLLNMVENLLSITRIKNSVTKVKKSSEAVEEVISEAVTRLKKRIPHANIVVSVPNEFLMIPMDAILIEQVIINLLENAIIHSESTKPIELKITSNNTVAAFHIIDYGIGIDENRINDLFEGFPAREAHTADNRKGMGIGLSICKTIILAHDGKISAKNHEYGAEFYFELPKEELNE
ncbi:sensor histidine kinase [Anaeromicropila populeti]|uniref:histidine kinase n=1 Tax=Anaeromicropila populeti TaxID=37658 RepID=A0A1I6LCK4_9FIRM|nr:ATP-binding protein [Anaeromicropila populeti]SFS01211.1 two-component system, OmpR family, sensor histidine kinase KdpD [Anaeromicropila populeti]